MGENGEKWGGRRAKEERRKEREGFLQNYN